MTLLQLLRPRILNGASFLRTAIQAPASFQSTILSRFKSTMPPRQYRIKTHKGAQARWHKTNHGSYKHGPIGVKHGNLGWRRAMLSRASKGGYANGPGKGNHIKRIKRLLPNA
ncbi:hypothetical protein V1512DRAFT_226544 [Lipomyces arxii]|uniref:uncharacterized protein n=1 Tax=Lipomyces arxii TaxID=56418 RepID=UPI0034D01C7F